MLTIADFFDAAKDAGLTTPASWTPAGGAATALDGYFDAQYGVDQGMEMARPSFRVPTTAVPAVAHGDAVTINAVNYTIAEIATDMPNVGELMLFLRKAP